VKEGSDGQETWAPPGNRKRQSNVVGMGLRKRKEGAILLGTFVLIRNSKDSKREKLLGDCKRMFTFRGDSGGRLAMHLREGLKRSKQEGELIGSGKGHNLEEKTQRSGFVASEKSGSQKKEKGRKGLGCRNK